MVQLHQSLPKARRNPTKHSWWPKYSGINEHISDRLLESEGGDLAGESVEGESPSSYRNNVRFPSDTKIIISYFALFRVKIFFSQDLILSWCILMWGNFMDFEIAKYVVMCIHWLGMYGVLAISWCILVGDGLKLLVWGILGALSERSARESTIIHHL